MRPKVSVACIAVTLIAFASLFAVFQTSSSFAQEENDDTYELVENFVTPTLQEPWFWLREDSDNWFIDGATQQLVITTTAGTLDKDHLINNMLLRPNPAGPAIWSARLNFVPTQTAQESSIFLYNDDDNYIKISRIFNDETLNGDMFLFVHERDGELVETGTLPVESGTVTFELTLVHSGGRVVGYVDVGTGERVEVGSSATNEEFTHFGLSSYHGVFVDQPAPITAQFDEIERDAFTVASFMPIVVR